MKVKELNRIESGTSISYACYIIAIILLCLLYAFNVFNVNLLVLEQELDMGLHLVENEVLTSKAGGDSKEEYRMYIVPEVTYDESHSSTKETERVNALGQAFTDCLQERLDLNVTKPKSGILLNLCGPNSDIMIGEYADTSDMSSPVENQIAKIIQPYYEKTITVIDKATGEAPVDEFGNELSYEEIIAEYIAAKANGDEELFVNKYEFLVEYEIDGWVTYILKYTNNIYTGFSKEISSTAPTLKNGESAKGATIESTICVTFYGVRKIFTDIGEQGYFKEHPEESPYRVNVTQAVDIVLVSQYNIDENGIYTLE